MIHGYFSEVDNNPYLAVEVNIPKFSIRQMVRFLVDTGASTTIINQGDAVRLGINFQDLNKSEINIGGIGGFAETYETEVTLLSEVKPIYSGVIHILEHRIPDDIHGEEKERMKRWFLSQPSLLGKNIIYDYGLFMHYFSKTMLFLEHDEIPLDLR